jgi:hypothetical protein
MQQSDLFVEDLGQNVNAYGSLAGFAKFNIFLAKLRILALVQKNLSQDLVGERARHDKGRMASGTAKINQTTFCKENDMAA